MMYKLPEWTRVLIGYVIVMLVGVAVIWLIVQSVALLDKLSG